MLIFEVFFGDELKKVEISQPIGTAGENWHISVNNYYHGEIHHTNDGYWYHGRALDRDDAQAILDRITDHKNEPRQLINYWPF